MNKRRRYKAKHRQARAKDLVRARNLLIQYHAAIRAACGSYPLGSTRPAPTFPFVLPLAKPDRVVYEPPPWAK